MNESMASLILSGDFWGGININSPSNHCPFLQERTEVVNVAVWHVDDFISDIDAVVSIYLLDLVEGDDVGTMYAHEV